MFFGNRQTFAKVFNEKKFGIGTTVSRTFGNDKKMDHSKKESHTKEKINIESVADRSRLGFELILYLVLK